MNTEHLMEIEREYSTGEREYPKTEMVSDCCGARTSEPDRDGLAMCSDCKDHCSVEPLIEEPWADTLEEANS